MKNTYNLYTIRRRLVRKSSVWIVSIILTVIYLGAMYSVAPAYVCSSYLMSSLFMFFLCEFISMSLHEKENDVFEEVLLLHCDNDKAYYLSRELLQLRMCLIFGLVLAIFPVIKAVTSPGFFTRQPTAADVLLGGGVILFCGVCGIETGDLFHSRIMNRRFGICAVILISILAVCKPGLIDTLPVFRILNIFLPPITDSLEILGNGDSFDKPGILLIILHMIVYSVIITIIKIIILDRKKYRM